MSQTSTVMRPYEISWWWNVVKLPDKVVIASWLDIRVVIEADVVYVFETVQSFR